MLSSLLLKLVNWLWKNLYLYIWMDGAYLRDFQICFS